MLNNLASLTGGGGFSGGSATATNGDTGGSAGSGNRTFNFGANPNTGLAGQPWGNPVLIVGAVVAVGLTIYAVTKAAKGSK